MEDYEKELQDTLQTCEHCGKDVGEYMINPYDQDMYGQENWEYICNGCYENLCSDI